MYLFRYFCLLMFSLTFNSMVFAQTVDSVAAPIKDTLIRAASLDTNAVIATVPADDSSISKKPFRLGSSWDFNPDLPFNFQILSHHIYYDFTSLPVSVTSQIRVFRGKEILFYSIVALFLFFALLKLAFAKYFNDLFRVFFRTTMKQRQIREQLMQTPLPSLLFNFFFIATAGLYINFMFEEYDFRPVDNFWLLYLYCCVGLALIYFFKFVGLKLCGWLFNMRTAADSYIFIVFIINKVIGIFLLPVLALLAFSDEPLRTTTVVLSWLGIGLLLVYRFILGYGVIRNEVRFNIFHFFLYLCAFEVAPLLLIYRGLLFFF